MTHGGNSGMNGERPYETDALDDEIARALAVDPSPDFVRRVRTRIAEEPRASAWRLAPLAGATVATVAVVASYLVWSVPAPVERRAPEVAVAVAPVSAEVTAPSTSSAPVPPTVPTGPPVAAEAETTAEPRRADSRGAISVPTAQAPSREMAGLLALRNSVWSGEVETPEPSVNAQTAASPIAYLAFPPIEIQPLPDLAQISGDRPW